jgi:hypothetical protein
MIYSEAFDGMPTEAKDAIYQRMWQVLSGADTNAKYARLSACGSRCGPRNLSGHQERLAAHEARMIATSARARQSECDAGRCLPAQLGVIIAYVDRTNLSVSLADASFKKFFQLDDTQRGLLNSVFFWSYRAAPDPRRFFCRPIRRQVSPCDRIRTVVLVSALSGATQCSLAIDRPSITSWCVRVGCDARRGPMDRLQHRRSRRGLAMGIYMAGTKFGSAVGAKLCHLAAGYLGWRQMFVILGWADSHG